MESPVSKVLQEPDGRLKCYDSFYSTTICEDVKDGESGQIVTYVLEVGSAGPHDGRRGLQAWAGPEHLLVSLTTTW